jgi:IS5 family transposase
MARRKIGQERFSFLDGAKQTELDALDSLVDWSAIDGSMADISCSSKGEPGWPPLCLFKAFLLARWYDLSDVKLAEALDDRASFRRFCGFARHEPTPERTAFVRFRKALTERGLGECLFEIITEQLRSKHVSVRRGTLIDATIIASASKQDEEARFIKHKGKKAVHGYKAHVASDETTDLVEKVRITPANVNDGRAGCDVVPDNPGQVYADSAYRGPRFRRAVENRGGVARIVQVGVWAHDEATAKQMLRKVNGPIHKVRGRIEKIFGTWKRSYGMRTMAHRGLAKATLQVQLCAIAYNLKRSLNILRAAAS